MTLNVVGETTDSHRLLALDWHRRLSDEQLAAYIRYQYIWQKDNAVDWDSKAHSSRRPTWDGGKDLYGVRRVSTWGEVAKRVRDNKADPGLWVHAHFSPAASVRSAQASSSIPVVRPSMLHSQASPQIYRKYVEFMPDVIWQQYEIAGRTIDMRFKTSASIGLHPDEQQLYVLCDESYVTAPPFFRHAFSAAAQCSEAIEQYLWLAALHYEAHQRVYDEVLIRHPDAAWWLTDELKLAVVAIRQHWEEYRG